MYSHIPTLLVSEALNTKSLLGQLVLNEMQDFKTKCLTPTLEINKGPSTQYFANPDTSGTLIPVASNMKSYTDLLSHRKAPTTRSTYQDLFLNVTKKILTLSGSYSFKQALLEIEKFRSKAGPHFYGAMLRSTKSKDKIINPYHLLTPLTYAKNPEIFQETEKFTILLYFYSNRKKISLELNESLDTTQDIAYVDKLLNLILMCSNHKETVKTPNIIEGFFSRDINTIDTSNSLHSPIVLSRLSFKAFSFTTLAADVISEEKFKGLDFTSSSTNLGNASLFLAAHQVMVNGIFAPDYSISLLKKGSSTLHGTFLTPTVSCNIQSSSTSSNLTWASVCTGRESQQTLKGISSLHCSNYASAYNSQSCSERSLVLADVSIQKTVTLYQKLKLLPIELTSTPAPEELVALNTDFMTYLDYMTTTFSLDLIAIEARYNYIKTLGQTNETDKNQNIIKNVEEIPKNYDASRIFTGVRGSARQAFSGTFTREFVGSPFIITDNLIAVAEL